MINRDKIELSSVEATAYWWINTIRSKVRELVIQGTRDRGEIKFVEIFYHYSEVQWRKLYLELIDYITCDINNYVPMKDIIGIDTFKQDTALKGHDRLNFELSKIMNHPIPDIRLANNGVKDSVIYTNMFGASVWYKSCGVTDLPTKYDPCYLLTGDEEELNFYNLLLSTIAILNEIDKTFKSTSLLREEFCKEYKKVNKSQETIEEIKEKFNDSFDMASKKEIILGRSWEGTYYTTFREIDYVGLEEYMDLAEYYAKVILQKRKENIDLGHRKRLKK